MTTSETHSSSTADANPADSAPVVVVGGGFAGLACAVDLARRGEDVLVFEAGKAIAGMAATYKDKNGFSYDSGAHFITNRLVAALGIGADCRDVAYYGESAQVKGRYYSYPFGLMTNPGFMVSALRSRARTMVGADGPIVTAADWFRAAYGDAVAESVALPLVEAWSGEDPTTLSAAVGGKMGSMVETMFLTVMKRVTGRVIGIGYSGEQRQSMHVWHVYPEGGVGVLSERMAEELGDRVKLESPVDKIFVDDGRVVAVRVGGREMPAKAVFSTAPVPILARMVDGSDALEPYKAFRYRGMIAVNVYLEGRKLLPDAVAWYPERQAAFYRLTEAPQTMPWLAPEGKTVITCDVGADRGDATWSMTDDALIETCLDGLQEIIPGVRKRFIAGKVVRLATAYPIYSLAYEAERQAWETSTGIDGLVAIGRNGEFGHLVMEDLFWRTQTKVRRWHMAQRAPKGGLRSAGVTAHAAE